MNEIVYIAETEHLRNMIKIGKISATDNDSVTDDDRDSLSKRMKSLSTAIPGTYQIVYAKKVPTGTETKLHKLFNRHRVGGEFFNSNIAEHVEIALSLAKGNVVEIEYDKTKMYYSKKTVVLKNNDTGKEERFQSLVEAAAWMKKHVPGAEKTVGGAICHVIKGRSGSIHNYSAYYDFEVKSKTETGYKEENLKKRKVILEHKHTGKQHQFESVTKAAEWIRKNVKNSKTNPGVISNVCNESHPAISIHGYFAYYAN